MQEESTLHQYGTTIEYENEGFHDAKLLITTANMRLYRMSKRGKYFLIKTIKDNSERQLQMLKREYELSIGVAHPHIVHVYTYEENLEVGPAIVMEYVEGCTLEEYLTGNISKKERNRLFEELLSAVGYLHKRGIIHNDLKPENILVTRADHTLKLIDFGLADDDSHYALKTLGCTPHYASPELREQSRNIDARSDIYSIGIIMQRLVGNSAIARQCTHHSPDKRYANIEALQRAWRNRHRPYLAVVAIVLLAMIILPTILLTKSKNENEQQQQQIEQQQQNIDEQQKEQQQIKQQQHKVEEQQKAKQQQRQEALNQLEQEFTAIYQRAKDSLTACPYAEFFWLNAIKTEDHLTTYQARIKDMADSSEFEAVLMARFEQLRTKYLSDICDLYEQLQLPSYRDMEPEENWPFYDSLIDNHLPYRPHPKKRK